MQLTVNWQTTPKGVGLAEGSRVQVFVDGDPDFIAWGIFNGHFPQVIGQTGAGKTTKNSADFIFRNTSLASAKGQIRTLKVWAYKNNVHYGFEKDFFVL